MKNTLFIMLLLCIAIGFSQADNDNFSYYEEIPASPKEYTPGAIVVRMIDGLGFRYYWATEGLTQTDLNYTPSSEARSLEETLDHIYGPSQTIVNSAKQVPTDFTLEQTKMTFDEKRKATLENFRVASALF